MPQGPNNTLIAKNADGSFVPLNCDDDGNLLVSGPNGGEAVSIADGADITQGAKADAVWVSGPGSVIALLKAIAGALLGILRFQVVGATAVNITTSTTTLVRTGAGTLQSLSVNTGQSGASVTIYDSLTATGTKLGTFVATAQVGFPNLNLAFATGLTVVTAGGSPADVTVGWHL